MLSKTKTVTTEIATLPSQQRRYYKRHCSGSSYLEHEDQKVRHSLTHWLDWKESCITHWSHKQQRAIKKYGKTLIESVCIDAGRLYSVRWILKYKDLNRW